MKWWELMYSLTILKSIKVNFNNHSAEWDLLSSYKGNFCRLLCMTTWHSERRQRLLRERESIFIVIKKKYRNGFVCTAVMYCEFERKIYALVIFFLPLRSLSWIFHIILTKKAFKSEINHTQWLRSNAQDDDKKKVLNSFLIVIWSIEFDSLFLTIIKHAFNPAHK